MRIAVLLAIAVAAFLGATLVPGDGPEPATGDDGPHAPQPAKAETSGGSSDSYAAWVAGTTELLRAADGHFYAETQVNGAQIDMLVDTGASVVALTGADARAAGLMWSAADIRPIAQGASGPVAGMAITLDRVTLGGHEARNVRAIIVPEGLGVSLLGQSFLASVQPVRIEQDRMVLGE